MTIMIERNLSIEFPDEFDVRKFDDPPKHGLGFMKAVDFIAYPPDRSEAYFIEFKDPQHPRAQDSATGNFIDEFESGGQDVDLIYKYRDSFLYEWAAADKDITGKRIYYYVLVAHDGLDKSLLDRRSSALKSELPVRAFSKRRWRRSIVEDCMVFNIGTWNERFPQFPVRRLPARPPPGRRRPGRGR